MGVVTPLAGGGALVELRVQLAVQELEGKEEDREGQVEVEEEKVELKEKRSWMTMEMFMTRLRSPMRCETTSKSARYVRAQRIMCTTQASV